MKKFKISVIIIMLGTLLSKALGLLREIILAQKYGTGYISDAFILSLNIPTVIIYSIASAIQTNYIPLFAQAESESEERASKFNGNLMSICLIISTILIILFMSFTKNIVKIFAVGFDDIALSYLVNISRITIFCIYFIVAAHIFKGYLEFKGKFLGTALYGIFMNIGIIFGIVLSSTERYVILGYGVLIGYILSFIILAILVKANRFKIKLNVDLKDTYIKKLVVLTMPIILNDVVWQINGIIDKSIATTIGAGYISAINYAHYIVDMVSSIFATSIITVFFPSVIKLFKEKGIETVKEKTSIILKNIIFIAIPATILISIYSNTIIRILFYRGEFGEESLVITSTAVSIYSIALIFVCIKTILFKVFYALQDTKTPTKSAIIAIISNIIFTLILIKPFGYKGIIIGTIISSIIFTILLFIKFKKEYGTLIDKQLKRNGLKIILASTLMLIIIFIVNNLTNNIYIYNELISYIIKPIIGAAIGLIVYILILVISKYNFKMIA